MPVNAVDGSSWLKRSMWNDSHQGIEAHLRANVSDFNRQHCYYLVLDIPDLEDFIDAEANDLLQLAVERNMVDRSGVAFEGGTWV